MLSNYICRLPTYLYREWTIPDWSSDSYIWFPYHAIIINRKREPDYDNWNGSQNHCTKSRTNETIYLRTRLNCEVFLKYMYEHMCVIRCIIINQLYYQQSWSLMHGVGYVWIHVSRLLYFPYIEVSAIWIQRTRFARVYSREPPKTGHKMHIY